MIIDYRLRIRATSFADNNFDNTSRKLIVSVLEYEVKFHGVEVALFDWIGDVGISCGNDCRFLECLC